MTAQPHSPQALSIVVAGGAASMQHVDPPVRTLLVRDRAFRRLAGGVAVFVVISGLAGCGNALPMAPSLAGPTLSGHIYQDHTPSTGEPLLADALVTVTDADGSARSAVSDRLGFYTVSTAAGAISVSVSKDGYHTGVKQVALANDTVLNFSLSPHSF